MGNSASQSVARPSGAWIAVVVGALSTLKLLELGFAPNFGTLLGAVLDAYDMFGDGILGDLGRVCIACAFVSDLHPHWKHVAVLMALYFFGGGGNEVGGERPATWAVYATWGFVVALATGIAAGKVALGQGEAWTNFLVAAIPLAGVAVFDVGASLWNATVGRTDAQTTRSAILTLHFFYTFRRAAAGLALLIAGLQAPFVQSTASPGLAMLGVLAVALAVYWLWQGAKGSASQAKLGATMLAVMILAGLVVVADAALTRP